MAIMVMGTVNKTKLAAAIATSLLMHPIYAGEWEFTPKFLAEEVYTDNVELTSTKNTSSLVSQAGINIESNYSSKLLTFNLSSKSIYAAYSHDHELDDDYQTLNSDFNLKLGQQGFALIGKANIDNRSRNNAKNALADIVSSDTVQVESYSGGIAYNTVNSQFIINSNIKYNLTNSEDNIGNFEGYSSIVTSKNGNASRSVFWDINGQYQERKNQNQTARSYQSELKIGFITSWKINPFLRYYDEDNSGTIQTGRSTESNSYGAGIRWSITPRFYLDASYNLPISSNLGFNGKPQSNYIDMNVNWQPSSRTTLTANYSQRFFGDTYGLSLSHRNRRLTNQINYKEEVRSFTRSNYQAIPLGSFWCPSNSDINLNDCFLENQNDINFDDYQLLTITDYELNEDDVFSLYKTLSWKSELALARTTFNLVAELSNREDLESLNEDDKTYINFSTSRAISGRSNINLSASYTDNWLRKNSSSERRDRYRRIAIGYSKSLNSKLIFEFDLANINRNSNTQLYNYEEGRVSFKITKEF